MVNLAKKTELKCELHCHTSYSWDCAVSVKQVIDYAIKKEIDVLAITDHNEINGAFEAQRLAPSQLQIIIGEEITTKEGHMIGLFLKEKIEPHQSAAATIAEIKRQGGIVLVPHAFDRLRGGLGYRTLLEVKDQIDFLEVFNARMLFAADNVKALEFAKEHKLASYVGSDSHTPSEYGNAISTISAFATQEEFVVALRKARFTTKLSGIKVYLLSEFVKLKKKFSKWLDRKSS